MSKNKVWTTEDFIEKAISIHGNKYDYSLVNYLSCKEKVQIICPKHGLFYQKPDTHFHSKGCFKCGRESCGKSTVNDTDYFIIKASAIHDGKYDYSKTIYVKNRESVIITCPFHGEFTQIAMHHLAGKGCKICAMSASNKETKWLNILGVPKENRNKALFIEDIWIKPDGFDPTTNTIYEFYGDYWHGNPKVYDGNKINEHNGKTFGELYQRTISRENMIIAAGFKLVAIWQNDFESQNEH